ncbi:hypothetical protein [Kitasatospora sp. NPDC002965]|uniref:hypothetical protein n=1 Tax=Kitasatospora sp. NPDC002965 TaxID=3154775 RepID=UPI0033A0FBE6
MRLRNAVLAATSAVALVLAVPVSANAADGVFRYTYRDGGADQRGELVDPPSGTCIDLPGATEADPAFAPVNRTGGSAVEFLEFGCRGDIYYTLKPGGSAGRRLHVRSVLFS